MTNITKPFELPLSKGSTRFESPPGETLRDFFYRYMARKEFKTGWRSGQLDKGDTRRPDKTPLDKPFVSLLTALKEAGFAANQEEAERLLQVLAAKETPKMGVRRKEGCLRYWVMKEPGQKDEEDF